jgi:hypothetical protein
MDASRITNVYIWSNDQVMVFDQYGHQMPEFQDHKDVALPKIKATGFKGPWFFGDWRSRNLTEVFDVEEFWRNANKV